MNTKPIGQTLVSALIPRYVFAVIINEGYFSNYLNSNKIIPAYTQRA